MARRLISAAASVGAAGTTTWRARRPSLMTWPSWVGPAVTGALAGAAAATAWFATDTAMQARTRPGLLVRRPLIAGAAAGGVLVLATAARSLLLPRLEQGGRDLDAGLPDPPGEPTVSGGPGSSVDYHRLGREGARYVHTPTPPHSIEEVMGQPAVATPIRVFIGWDSAESIDERVDLAMKELHRTGAFERSTLLVQSPAGSGYANPTPAQVVEIATRGDCASVAVGYGLLPSFLSLDRVELAAHTQRMLLDRVFAEVAARPADARPRVLLYGESLGARVQQRAIDPAALESLGVSSALWVGTPGGVDSDRFRRGLTDEPVIVDRPEQLPRPLPRPHPPVWFLEHDGDPVVRLRRDLLHRRPRWLTDQPRGRNIPEAMSWWPVVTWVQVLIDTLFATNIKPGEFDSRGHDYRADLGAVVAAAYDLPLPEGAEGRLEEVLRRLEVERARRVEGGI